MSKPGKLIFAFSAVAFFLLLCFRLVVGGWENFMWVPLGLFLFFFIAGLVKEFKFLKEFATLRTTKHGTNMGVAIFLMIVALACINYFAARYDKSFDWTSERLNSLSDQSVKAAQALKTKTELILLYRNENSPDAAMNSAPRAIQLLAEMYGDISKQISFSSYNALQRPDLTVKYEFTYGPHVFYAVQGERKVKIDPPTEEGVTRALLKLEHDKRKVLYLTRGHGELLIEDKGPSGLSILGDELSVTYEVKPLVLFESNNQVPDDASMVAIIGPKQQFLDAEIEGLRDYARRGGKFFIAIDPGAKHNLAQLTKTLGVEFGNDFVLDPKSRQLDSSPSLVLGTDFGNLANSATGAGTKNAAEITRAFATSPNAISLFELASSLKAAPSMPAEFEIESLVATDEKTASTPEIQENTPYQANGPHILAMVSRGTLASNKEGGKASPFSAVIFGDSDFLGNRLVHNNLNRDLATNSAAWLSDDRDLISIRPKQAKGSTLEFPGGSLMIWMIALILLPFAFFATSFLFWWRRRAA